MSLPTYGDIKDSSASVENVKSLSVDVKGGMLLTTKKSGVDATSSPSGDDEKSGPDLSVILPSVGKQSAKDRAAERAALEKAAAAAKAQKVRISEYDF